MFLTQAETREGKLEELFIFQENLKWAIFEICICDILCSVLKLYVQFLKCNQMYPLIQILLHSMTFAYKMKYLWTEADPGEGAINWEGSNSA